MPQEQYLAPDKPKPGNEQFLAPGGPAAASVTRSAGDAPKPGLLDRLADAPLTPITSYPAATLHGLENIGQGGFQALRGVRDLGASVINSWNDPKAMSPSDAILGGIGQLPSQAAALYRDHPSLGEWGDALGQTGGNVAATLAPEAVRGIPAAQAVRSATRGVNTVLEKAPGSVGAAAGTAIGHATGIPGAAEVGGVAGYGIGREILPKIRIPGEGFGLPNRVTGGPAVAPAYEPPPVAEAEAPAASASPAERVTKAPDIAKVEAPKVKPVADAKSAAERRQGYLFGEHSGEYDPENLAHRKIKDMTHEELASQANARSLKGKTDWKADDFKRSVASHGKSSNPNASFVRGQLLNEANVKPVSGGSQGADIQWPKSYQDAPRTLSLKGGGGANYSAADLDAFKAKHGISGGQGGHAGGGVSSVEELSRPGKNYLVNKHGGLTYHGKSFAPEETPAGGAHITALPDGTIRVNAGDLTPQMKTSLLKGLKEK